MDDHINFANQKPLSFLLIAYLATTSSRLGQVFGFRRTTPVMESYAMTTPGTS